MQHTNVLQPKILVVRKIPASNESFNECLIRPFNIKTRVLKRPSLSCKPCPWK
ncbi:unnamed protein product [Brugia timori]|uniref:Bm13051 n=2 Tax=Brugia TaxID=6278 RepID=A0A1I9GF13_BRUMA|nr:Bm13051 [Brugia malayi]VDO26271.1 unnamed protein product [Brugia timori]